MSIQCVHSIEACRSAGAGETFLLCVGVYVALEIVGPNEALITQFAEVSPVTEMSLDVRLDVFLSSAFLRASIEKAMPLILLIWTAHK